MLRDPDDGFASLGDHLPVTRQALSRGMIQLDANVLTLRKRRQDDG